MNDKLIGSVMNPDVVYGKSAYEIAVKHGYDGTEEEWIASVEANRIAAQEAKESAVKSEGQAEYYASLAELSYENAQREATDARNNERAVQAHLQEVKDIVETAGEKLDLLANIPDDYITLDADVKSNTALIAGNSERITNIDNKLSEEIADNFKVGVYLYANTNLNDLTEAGVYYCDSYSIGSTLLNTPTHDAFKMVVNNLYAPTRPQQIIYGSETSKVYRRVMRASGWEAWEQFATYEGMADKRKIAMFGDSITWGRDGNDAVGTVVRVSNPYPKIVGKQMRITCDNFGVGGSGYLTDGDDGKTAYEKISSTDIANYDYITLAFGVNDVLSKPLGEWNSTDETTIMGQMNKTINYIYEQNPNCVVIVIGAWNGRNVGTFPNFKFSDPLMIAMDEAYKTCCEYYGLPYISQKDCPINGFTMSTLMGEDGVHPSALGYERIGYWMAGKLKALIG